MFSFEEEDQKANVVVLRKMDLAQKFGKTEEAPLIQDPEKNLQEA